jgi:hypothetical protein
MMLSGPDLADFAAAVERKLAKYERELAAIPPLVRELLHMCGYLQGYERGQKEGRTAGRRRAKGLPPAKKRGRPAETDEIRGLLFKDVEERPPKQKIPKAVYDSLRAYHRGQHIHAWEKTLNDELRLADPPLEPPDHVLCEADAMAEVETGKYCNAYYRWRRHPPAGYQPVGGSTADKSATAPVEGSTGKKSRVGKRVGLGGRTRRVPVRARPDA